MENFIDHIKDKWLEWESVIYAFLVLMTVYATLANIPAIQPISLQLALIFVCILAGYTICCAIHVRNEKLKTAGLTDANKLTCKFKVLFCSVIAVCILVIISALFILFYNSQGNFKDGKYVIWADEYRIALTPEVRNSYYLEGEKIHLVKGELGDYSKHCVFELDFNKDDTFTIKYRDSFLGMTPGQNGIGYSDSSTSINWKLEEAGEGLYYIINADEDAYLKWYPDKDNWTTNNKLINKYKEQYLLCIEKVG